MWGGGVGASGGARARDKPEGELRAFFAGSHLSHAKLTLTPTLTPILASTHLLSLHLLPHSLPFLLFHLLSLHLLSHLLSPLRRGNVER